MDGDSPLIRFVDADGTDCEIQCEVVAGTDGSRSICRFLIPENQRVHYFKEYPFAWFGVLSESPFNAPELIYAHSERGFALISQRTEKIQRLYFQCPIDEDVELWSNQQIWDELQARVDGDDGFELKQGPIFERTLLRFRSFVAEPMRWGRLVLAGDAAHTVPPTGAKGLNLAINDVRILHECLVDALGQGGSLDALDAYGPRALDRIWKSENFSYWMTQMLHTPVDSRQLRPQAADSANSTPSCHRQPVRPTSPSPTPVGRTRSSPECAPARVRAAPELTEIGAAIAMSANSTREFARLGLLDQLAAVSTVPTELI